MTAVAPPSSELWLVELDRLAPPLVLQALTAAALRARSAVDLAHLPRADIEPGRALAHLALRCVLVRHAGIANALAPFERRPLGKPALAGSPLDFSLSHSQARALIAVSRAGAIGCDIEAPRTPRLPEGKRALIIEAAVDVARGAPLSGHDPEQRFLQAWVRLEAAAKATGEGMGRLLTRYGIFGTAADRASLSIANAAVSGTGVRIRDLDVGAGYAAAVAEPEAIAPAVLRAFPVSHDTIADLLA